MAEELGKLGRPHLLKIYPPVGKTPDDGLICPYTAVGRWENDVFKFLDQQPGERSHQADAGQENAVSIPSACAS